MSNHQILNNVDHKDLRVDTRHADFPGNNVLCVLAIPSEFRDLHAEYPIFLHRDEDSGRYLPMAMFGLQRDENLYLDQGQWQADYIPLMIQRGPCLIGFQGEGEDRKRVISIDVDDARVGSGDGEPLFEPFGGNSAYTDRLAEVLQRIDEGQDDIQRLCEALEQHGLIEPFSLDVTLEDDSKHKLTGFYTVHEERLAELDGSVLAEFSRSGILQAAYLMVYSLSNLRHLIKAKNTRLQGDL